MATPEQYSATNIENSVSGYLATKLLAQGYLVHWFAQDAVETPDGWYPNYGTYATTYAADATFRARVAAAKAIVTLRGPLTANPAYVVRHTSSGTTAAALAADLTGTAAGTPDEVWVPAFAVDVAPPTPVALVGLGMTEKFRTCHLIVQGFARDQVEQKRLAALLANWFDGTVGAPVVLEVQDHDAGSATVVGTIDVLNPTVLDDIEIDGPEATTFAVELHARLEYCA